MLLPRRSSQYFLPSLLGLVTVIFLCGEIFITSTNAQITYSENPPRYSYDKLPRTSFTCKGKLPGRYYPDPETDCQMFHVCVKMSHRDIQDFKFLCPNGTVFDAEHQVCVDYYQVVCQTDGTNPLGQIFEIFKLSSGQGNRELDSGKLSFVNTDSVEKNTLGDDFQVQEYNTNHLAKSQNALNFRASDPAPSPKPVTRSQKAKEDIFFSNKGFIPSTSFNPFSSTTTRRTPTTARATARPTTTTSEAPSSSTPRRPSLETFESYETESFSGFLPTRNSFNQFSKPQDPSPDFDASVEDFTPKDDNFENFRNRNAKPSTTARPLVFQNTFRTTLSHVPPTSRPSAQTFQQQPTRFNEEFFTRIPTTTRRPVSKAAQFFLYSTTAEETDFTPEYRQPTAKPYVSSNNNNNNNNHRAQPSTTTTTIRPSVVFQANSGTVRPRGNPINNFQYEPNTTPAPRSRHGGNPTSSFQYEPSTTPAPRSRHGGNPTSNVQYAPSTTPASRPRAGGNPTTNFQYTPSTTRAPRPTTTTTTTTETPSTTTEYFGRYRQTEDDFETKQTTYSGFIPTTKNSNLFGVTNKDKPEFGGKSSTQRQFPPELSTQYVEEESLRPRNIHGGSNPTNTLNIQPSPEIRPRDNFGFSTVPPPTTAEPFSTPAPTTVASAVTQQETSQTLAARLQGQLFKKITAKNPEKFSIFFGRSTQSLGDDRLPAPGPTTVYYDNQSTTSRPRHRVRSTTANPLDQTTTQEPVFDRRGRLSRFNSVSSAVTPDHIPTSTTTQRPLRRGVRRRVRPANRPEGEVTQFDPQLKYTRRRFESGRIDKEGQVGEQQKNDEIFNAEASVFRGDPTINNFFQEKRKGVNSGSQKTNDRIDQAHEEQPSQQRSSQPENHFVKFYGRRVRPNGGGGDAPQNNNNERNFNNGEGQGGGERRRPSLGPLPPGSSGQIRRRVVKRLRPKNGTDTDNLAEGNPRKQFFVTGSTLRPVTRINVKSKLGGKISTTYRTTEITDGSPSPTASATTTTEEPELVTASEDVVEDLRHRNHPSTTTSQAAPTYRPFAKKPFSTNNFNNNSHLVIKVISEKPISPTPSFPSAPLSIKKPILNGPGGKKQLKPGARKNINKSTINADDEESPTKSPDYDYAYYNSDDATDYDAETSNIDHKNYGRKPKNE